MTAQKEALAAVITMCARLWARCEHEYNGRGSSADRIDAWEALRDAYEKLQETES